MIQQYAPKRQQFCVTSIDFFENEVESVGLLEILNQLDDVFVPATMIKGVNFLKDTRTRVSWHLVNDLDSKLLIRPDIAASPHRGIGALAQNLAR